MSDPARTRIGAAGGPGWRRAIPPAGLALRALLVCAAYYFGTRLGYALIFPSSHFSIL